MLGGLARGIGFAAGVVLLALAWPGLAPAGDAWAADAKPEPIQIFTYHGDAPFYDQSTGQGYSRELAVMLNNAAAGKYVFRVEFLPRKRLNQMLLEKDPVGIVPWISPMWFGDPEQKKYLWSAPLMTDRDVVMSSPKAPIDYQEPGSLRGKTLAAPRAYRFAGIDELVANGLITRVDVTDELSALMMVGLQRADAAIMGATVAQHLIKQNGLELEIAATPHSLYDRLVMVLGSRTDLLDFVNQAIASHAGNAPWRKAGGDPTT